MGPFEEQLFCEASQENSHKARARMLRAEGIRVPGSKEIRGFYRIPCVGFSPFSFWNVGWLTTSWLKIAEQRLFYICTSFRLMRGLYRDKSNNALVVIGATARYRSVLSHFSLIFLACASWLGQLYVSLLFIRCVCCDALHLEKQMFEMFLHSCLAALCEKANTYQFQLPIK